MLSYDVLAKKDPENRWQIRVKMIARLLGCYQVLRSAGTQQPTDDGEEGGGGGGPVAGSRSVMKADEEIGKFLARVYGTVDMEKSDFALGLVLASVLQAHQRRRLMVERMIDKGIVPSPKIKTLAEEGDSIALARRGSTRPDVVVIRIHPDAMADGHGPSEDESEGGAHSSEVDDSPGSAFQEWLRAVNEGSKVIIAPVSMEAAVAPSMRMSERSALYTEPCSPVDGQMLNEAREWAVYAAATYGRTAFIEKETHEEQIR